MRPGDLIWVDYAGRKVRFKVVWVRDSESHSSLRRQYSFARERSLHGETKLRIIEGSCGARRTAPDRPSGRPQSPLEGRPRARVAEDYRSTLYGARDLAKCRHQSLKSTVYSTRFVINLHITHLRSGRDGCPRHRCLSGLLYYLGSFVRLLVYAGSALFGSASPPHFLPSENSEPI